MLKQSEASQAYNERADEEFDETVTSAYKTETSQYLYPLFHLCNPYATCTYPSILP
jgi:hypothetical protein